MTVEHKIWAVIHAITEAIDLSPVGQILEIEQGKLEEFLNVQESEQIIKKLAYDEKVIELIKLPNSIDPAYHIRIPDTEIFKNFYDKSYFKFFGSLEKLSADNFFAVVDVTLDIQEELEMNPSQEIIIPIKREIIRFRSLYPGHSPNMMDRYCDLRMKAIEYLKENEHIRNYELHPNHWDSKISIILDRKDFLRFYKRLIEIYSKKVISKDSSKDQDQETSMRMGGLEKTDHIMKVEIAKMPDIVIKNLDDKTPQKERQRESPIELSFPEPVRWDKVTLKIKDGRQEVEISYDNSHIITADYRQLRFFVGKKQQKPNRQWGFLCSLATLAATDIKRITAENMRSMIVSGETLSANNVQQIKKTLTERLKDIFKTSDDPFHDRRDYYEPKFKILPEPALRREEIWPQGGRLNENRGDETDRHAYEEKRIQEDSEEEAL